MSPVLTRIREDAMREVRIEAYRQQMLKAKSDADRLFAWRCMCAEIRARSPEAVARMEREKGLA